MRTDHVQKSHVSLDHSAGAPDRVSLGRFELPNIPSLSVCVPFFFCLFSVAQMVAPFFVFCFCLSFTKIPHGEHVEEVVPKISCTTRLQCTGDSGPT